MSTSHNLPLTNGHAMEDEHQTQDRRPTETDYATDNEDPEGNEDASSHGDGVDDAIDHEDVADEEDATDEGDGMDEEDAVDEDNGTDEEDVNEEATREWLKEFGHHFLIISILGPPCAGKSTICQHLVDKYEFSHEKILLRVGLSAYSNEDHPETRKILEKIRNNEYIGGEVLQSYIRDAIEQSHDRHERGVLFDDYPRRMEQIETGFNMWNFENDHPWLFIRDEERYVPDLVFYLDIDSETALSRCFGGIPETQNDREEFEKAFADSVHETLSILDAYRQRGVLVEINATGGMDEVIAEVDKQLKMSSVLKDTVNGK